MLAPATDTFGTLLRPRPDGPEHRATVPPRLLRSVMPALDRAFGLPDRADLPDDLAALVARFAAASGSRHGPDADAERIRTSNCPGRDAMRRSTDRIR